MLEGLSFIVLVFIAMPIKYIGGDPTWVTHVGRIHGLLFVAFGFTLYDAKSSEGWTAQQALVPFVAALLPFGPFIIDRRLKSGQI
jgi:integral membrane protein